MRRTALLRFRMAATLGIMAMAIPQARSEIVPIENALQAQFDAEANRIVNRRFFAEMGGPIDDAGVQIAVFRSGPIPADDQLRQQIIQVLHTGQVGDSWTWRDTMEDRLVAFGNPCLPLLNDEINNQNGLARDALEVAVFRLNNAPLNPHDTLLQWAYQHFEVPADAQSAAVIKISRVLGINDLFPHHLFYVLEFPAKKLRVSVALAADAKVQSLSDDAALEKFFRTEALPQRSDAGRRQLAQAAALFALARVETNITPPIPTIEPHPPGLTATARSVLNHAAATLTFTPAGQVQTMTLEPKAANTPLPAAPASPPLK